MAPTGIPTDIQQLLQNATQQILKEQDVRSKLTSLDLTPVGSTAEQGAKRLKQDTQKWTAVVKRIGLQSQ